MAHHVILEVSPVTSGRTVTVFGAYGHTGRFVVAELQRRGWIPILAGRDVDKLRVVGAANRDLEIRCASVDLPASLDDALASASAVINCAGPFFHTAGPVIDAALRARIPYLDVTAEVDVAAAAFDQHASRAREAGIVVVPAMAFYGGLADLLATAAMGDWSSVDEITLAYALDSWKPTPGTRNTGQTSKLRRDGRRAVFANGRVELRDDTAPIVDWTFPAPFGNQRVIAEYTTAASVLISRHVKTHDIRSYMTAAPLADLSGPDLSPLAAIDARGRSSQTFLVEATARVGRTNRRAVARGRDIYAVTAPLVVEAMERIARGPSAMTGVVTPGEVFEARDFLKSLEPEHLSLDIHAS